METSVIFIKITFSSSLILNIGGYHKTTHKTIKTEITLSYFYAKILQNREYIHRNYQSYKKGNKDTLFSYNNSIWYICLTFSYKIDYKIHFYSYPTNLPLSIIRIGFTIKFNKLL